jgi:3-oxoadipate CoA-transferase alpha subunit
MAAKTSIIQCRKIVEVGQLDPESVVTPGIFVKRVVEISDPAHESKLVNENKRYPWIKL